MAKLDKKLADFNIALDQKVDQQFSSLDKKLIEHVKKNEKEVEEIKAAITNNTKTLEKNSNDIREQIKTQEDIIMSMIRKFDDQYIQDKERIARGLEFLKNEVDTFKISLTLNEKKLLEQIKVDVIDSMKEAVKNQEKEVLMKLWIKDLKDIIKDFDKLKKAQPREFLLQIRQITDVIEMFKTKLSS